MSILDINPVERQMQDRNFMNASDQVSREILRGGIIRLSCDDCSFVYRRLSPGVLLVQISGNDRGQFGTASQDEVALEFDRCERPLQLFVDAAGAIAPGSAVMENWTAWFAANRHRMKQVAILVGREAKVLQLTVKIARHLSRTENLIAIHLDAQVFRETISQAAPGAELPYGNSATGT